MIYVLCGVLCAMPYLRWLNSNPTAARTAISNVFAGPLAFGTQSNAGATTDLILGWSLLIIWLLMNLFSARVRGTSMATHIFLALIWFAAGAALASPLLT